MSEECDHKDVRFIGFFPTFGDQAPYDAMLVCRCGSYNVLRPYGPVEPPFEFTFQAVSVDSEEFKGYGFVQVFKKNGATDDSAE